ncbi:uncharacterized protein LOC142487216 isoform X7 [Ascaphus truei]|uniref:uncharacterized protein LOC142487216 isoform X7 n=1 Tax=Ascaphus truei TaxID=8439 RepID=UPI003F5A9340
MSTTKKDPSNSKYGFLERSTTKKDPSNSKERSTTKKDPSDSKERSTTKKDPSDSEERSTTKKDPSDSKERSTTKKDPSDSKEVESKTEYGLQHVTQFNVRHWKICVYKCYTCLVSGKLFCMMQHLTGVKHIQKYLMRAHKKRYTACRLGIKSHKFTLKRLAKEIEKIEGVSKIKVKDLYSDEKHYTVDFFKNFDEENDPMLEVLPDKMPHLTDWRSIALKYSETFKISSWTEAALVLSLTEDLDTSLRNYLKNSKGAPVEASSSYGHKNSDKHKTSSGINIPQKRKSVWDNEEPGPATSSTYTVSKLFSFDSSNGSSTEDDQISEDDQITGKAKASAEEILSGYDPISQSSSSSGLKKKMKTKWNNEEPSTSSSSDFPTNPVVANPPSCTTSSSHGQSSETQPTNIMLGRTSKVLTSDLLELLKGKDVNTVTNILKTLSPFYPALQEVNLAIFAKVLVETGALDDAQGQQNL